MGGEKQSEVSVGADPGSGDAGDKEPQEPAGMEALDGNARNALDGNACNALDGNARNARDTRDGLAGSG